MQDIIAQLLSRKCVDVDEVIPYIERLNHIKQIQRTRGKLFIEDNEFIHYSEDYRIHYIACVTVEAVVNVDESSSWSESESNYTIFWLLIIDCNMIAI